MNKIFTFFIFLALIFSGVNQGLAFSSGGEYWGGYDIRSKNDFKNRKYDQDAMISGLIISKSIELNNAGPSVLSKDQEIKRGNLVLGIADMSHNAKLGFGRSAFTALNDKSGRRVFYNWRAHDARGLFSAHEPYKNKSGKICRNFVQRVDVHNTHNGIFTKGEIESSGRACKIFKNGFLVWELYYQPQSIFVTRHTEGYNKYNFEYN